jgi:hypothetical protein
MSDIDTGISDRSQSHTINNNRDNDICLFQNCAGVESTLDMDFNEYRKRGKLAVLHFVAMKLSSKILTDCH